MKKSFIITILVLLSCAGFTTKAFALGNQLTFNNALPAAGPYQCGSIVQHTYDMSFVKLQGTQVSVKIQFDPTVLSLVSNTIAGFSTPVITTPNATTTIYTYTSATFSAADNNFTNTSAFDVRFLVVNTSCSQSKSASVMASLSTINGSSLSDIVSTNRMVATVCNSQSASINMQLMWGDNCGWGFYKIISMGLDNPMSTISVTLPGSGVVQNAYNSIGMPVPVTNAGSTYTWDRDGDPNSIIQIHYALINTSPSLICPCTTGCNIAAILNTHSVCNPSATATASSNIALNCCSTGGSGTGGVSGGTGVPTPPNTAVVSTPNGPVLISKILNKVPFRYLPAPDNCRIHQYIVSVYNLSTDNLENFHLKDLIDDINLTTNNEIEVTSVTATHSNIFPATAVSPFNCVITPAPTSANSYTLGSTTVAYNTGDLPGTNSALDITAQNNALFPAKSQLQLTINHRLGSILPATNDLYDNKATIDFSINGTNYNGNTHIVSTADKYEPVLSLTKNVKNLTTNPSGPYVHFAGAEPGNVMSFQLKIANKGMSATSASLTDIITELPASINNYGNIIPSSVVVTETSPGGSVYTTADLTQIQNTIVSSLQAGGFNCTIQNILPGACLGYSELTITYSVQVQSVVNCQSEYDNKATLSWNWGGTPYTLQQNAVSKIDLFKGLEWKLEATCKQNAASADWSVKTVNALPNKPIYYRVTVRNPYTFPINGIKLMVQMPIGNTGYSTTHTMLPSGVTLSSSMPNAGPSASYSYDGMCNMLPAFTLSPNATNNWLTTSAPIGTATGTNRVFYITIPTLAPNTTGTLTYSMMMPVAPLGARFRTAMGISLYSGSGTAECPIAKSDTLTAIIGQSNPCGQVSACDMFMYNASIIRVGTSNKFRVTIGNLLDANGGLPPNIGNIEVVVHQPYKNYASTGTPFGKPMLSYSLSNISSTVGGAVSILNNKAVKVTTSVIAPYSSISFDIDTYLVPPSALLIFPMNIIFRDASGQCAKICEKMVYLRYKY